MGPSQKAEEGKCGFCFLGLCIAVMAMAAVGCGGSESQTPLQETEDRYRELHVEVEDVQKEYEAKSDEYLAKSDEVLALLDESREDISEGDLSSTRGSRDEQKKLQEESNELRRESNELNQQARPLEDELDEVATKIEGLKGCDARCRAARDRAAELSTRCLQKYGQRYPFKEVLEVCDERFPMPRENILKGVLQGG